MTQESRRFQTITGGKVDPNGPAADSDQEIPINISSSITKTAHEFHVTGDSQVRLRKVILWNMVSLEGFFEGPAKGQIDWFRFDEELEHYILTTQSMAGTFLFGRKTYEMMANYWPNAEGKIASFMNRVEKVVFSRTLQNADWTNTRLVRENIPDFVNQLKQQPGGDIFLVGSAELTARFIQHNLIDEYRFGINPVILGAGEPLIKQGVPRRDLKLVYSKVFSSGLVVLYYRPE